MSRRPVPEIVVLTFPSGRELARRVPRLVLGILLLGCGIAPVLEAELGVAPWDVFHQGLADLTGLSFGLITVLVGLVVLLSWIPLRQRMGLGTIVNTLTLGFVINAALAVIPHVESLPLRWAMLLGGIVVTAAGMALYIGAGLGPGPRDGLMTALAARGHPLWLVRTLIEVVVLAAGLALGGDVGIGTVLFAFGIGPIGHWFLGRFHLGVGGVDPDPTATIGE
ncbi:MAG: hypothetical protein WDA60_08065 [Acidimicrobiia bacterium]|jgi:uncharacterized membrane protein YczE